MPERINANRPTHAGCVVYRVRGKVKEYLMITATGNDKDWVLPKGHIEPGEASYAAAIRELKEEAGLATLSIEELGTTRSFIVDDEAIVVQYFLVECNSNSVPESGEKRNFKWLELNDFLAAIKYPETKEVVEKLNSKF